MNDYKVKGQEKPEKILPKEKETVDCIKYNMDGKLLAIGAMNGVIKVYDTKTWELKHNLEGPSEEIRVNFSILKFLFFLVFSLAF